MVSPSQALPSSRTVPSVLSALSALPALSVLRVAICLRPRGFFQCATHHSESLTSISAPSSSSSSIATSSSSTSLSSLFLLTPDGLCGPTAPPFACSWVAVPFAAGAVGLTGNDEATDGGALKMDFWSSVDSALVAAAVGMRKVPSSFAIVSDFDFA